MWYRISRKDYAKYQLFPNFENVVTKIFDVIQRMNNQLNDATEQYKKDVLANKNSNPYYEYPIVEQAKKDFGVHILESSDLKLSIPVSGVMKGGFGAVAEYDNRGNIYINLQAHAIRRVSEFNDVARILAHELQHATEHAKQNYHDSLSNKELNKTKQWADSAEYKMTQRGDEPLYFTRYYNQPTEVRARLVETLLHYGLPGSKLTLQDKLRNDNTYQAYSNLIEGAITKNIVDQLSNEAVFYMIKELYKAIWD